VCLRYKSVGLLWNFFPFLFLFSLMHLKFIPALLKNNHVLWFVILLILASILLTTIYLFFLWFLKFNFFSISTLGILFNFDFYIQFGPSTFDCSFSVFIYFSLFFSNFVSCNFIAFVFLIQFWSSLLLFIFSYSFLDLSFFWFCPSTFYFIFLIKYWSSFFQACFFNHLFDLFCFSI
jgi:hypothetical protein